MEEKFNIICSNIEEFKDIQIYLFNKNYEWITSGKKIVDENIFSFPIAIIEGITYHAKDILIKKIRKQKLLKLKNK